MAELRNTGSLKLDINGTEAVLSEEDLLIETLQKEGIRHRIGSVYFRGAGRQSDSELIEEGFVRELISKIQTMRKEAGFEVMDKIRVYARDNRKIEEILAEHGEEIRSEVLAEEIILIGPKDMRRNGTLILKK